MGGSHTKVGCSHIRPWHGRVDKVQVLLPQEGHESRKRGVAICGGDNLDRAGPRFGQHCEKLRHNMSCFCLYNPFLGSSTPLRSFSPQDRVRATLWVDRTLWVDPLAEGKECSDRWLEWFWCHLRLLNSFLFFNVLLVFTLLRRFSWLQGLLKMLQLMLIIWRLWVKTLSWRPRDLVDVWHEA